MEIYIVGLKKECNQTYLSTLCRSNHGEPKYRKEKLGNRELSDQRGQDSTWMDMNEWNFRMPLGKFLWRESDVRIRDIVRVTKSYPTSKAQSVYVVECVTCLNRL